MSFRSQKEFIGRLKRFFANKHGAIAPVFGGIIIAVIMAIGTAVDFGDAFRARSHLQNAADAAVLTGSRAARDYAEANPKAKVKDIESVGTKETKKMFLANVGELIEPLNVKYDAAVTEKGKVDSTTRRWVSELSFTAEINTSFLAITGKKSIEVAGEANAENSKAHGYLRVNFVVDASNSMGIGATTADIQTLESKIGCAFACHSTKGGTHSSKLATARATGAELRIDSVRNAIIKILKQLEEDQVATNQYEVAIYSFSNRVRDVLEPTTNLDEAIKAAEKVDLIGGPVEAGSNFSYTADYLAKNKMKKSGEGNAVNSRLTYTIVLTDGVEDSIMYSTSQKNWVFDSTFIKDGYGFDHQPYQTIQAINGEACSKFSNLDHKVMAIKINYVVPNTSSVKDKMKDEVLPYIDDEMKDCVSKPEYLFSATWAADIDRAAAELLTQFQKEGILRVTK